jgi:hypothetical protein
MNDGTGTDQEMNMNAADAAAIIAEAGARARRTLRPDHRVTFTVYGAIWFLGDGLMWLLVRGQHPYHGVNPGGYAGRSCWPSWSRSLRRARPGRKRGSAACRWCAGGPSP